MAAWSEVSKLAPDLSAKVRGRFEAHGLALLATIRKDGFPRLGGIEPMFGDDVWLGMMPDSRKAADLMADGRLSLHSATEDKTVANGDAKLVGRGIWIDQDEVVDTFRQDFAARNGAPPPPGPMHLFRVDVKEISFLRPVQDHLVIEWWQEGQPVKSVDRY